jgi:hypothetical protein
MGKEQVFAFVDPELKPVLEELRCREPIFHRAAFGENTAEFGRRMDPSYWEVGASGRRYSREFIMQAWSIIRPLMPRRRDGHALISGFARSVPTLIY